MASTGVQKSLLEGHEQTVTCIAVNDPQVAVLSGSEDSTCRLWDLRTNKSVRHISKVFSGEALTSVVFHPTNPNFVFASSSQTVFEFDLRTDSVLMTDSSRDFSCNSDDISQIAIHPKGQFLASADDSGEVKVIDLQSNRIFKSLRVHDNICSSVQFRPGVAWDAATGAFDSSLVLWCVW
jgi:WD40 repeat protein